MSKLIEQHVSCEACGSSDARSNYDDGHGYCFACSTYFPSGKSPDVEYTYEHLPWRNISKKTMQFYDVKTKVDPEGKPVSIGFQYPNDAYKVRQFATKAFHSVNKPSGLFGRNRFSAGSHKYVTITEGELDALSMYQVVGSPCVSVSSSSSAFRDCSVERSWLQSFERIYLAFDNDAAGREAVHRVAKLFDYNKVYLVKFTSRKDANEYLVAGEDSELRNIWHNSKKYLPEAIVSSFSDFETILTEQHKPSVSYPFPTLNAMTYGMRTGESVLITALEGVGKTEVMHAIEYHLLKETDDAIGAIFLEEPKRRHLQALAGIHLRKPAHLPDSGVTDSATLAGVKEVVRLDDRLHLYSHFGSDDPEVLLDHIRFLVTARACRWVLLDHLTMVVSGLAGDDERRALDYLSTRLEMMVKELDFGLILVSHVNDFGQTRGSRYIGKIADIRIDLTRDLTSEDFNTRCTTFMKVSKNRFCGRTGNAGALLFDPLTYTLSETVVPSNDNDLLEAVS